MPSSDTLANVATLISGASDTKDGAVRATYLAHARAALTTIKERVASLEVLLLANEAEMARAAPRGSL